MAFIFNPEIIERIFHSLTYFRTWVILFLFPVVVICPDLAFNFLRRLFYPTPTDVIFYNELDFKESKKQIVIQQLNDVIDPFADDNAVNVNILKERTGDNTDNNINNNNNNTNKNNDNFERIPEIVETSKMKIDLNDAHKVKNDHTKSNAKRGGSTERDGLVYNKNKVGINPELNNFISENKEVYGSNNSKGEEQRKKAPTIDKKKDSIFVDMDFEVMEGKIYMI